MKKEQEERQILQKKKEELRDLHLEESTKEKPEAGAKHRGKAG